MKSKLCSGFIVLFVALSWASVVNADESGAGDSEPPEAVEEPASSVVSDLAHTSRLKVARTGTALAMAVGIPTMVVGLTIIHPGYSLDKWGALASGNWLIWGSLGVSLGGGLLAHRGHPNYHYRKFVAGLVLATIGAAFSSITTSPIGWMSGFYPLLIPVGITGIALVIAGNTTMMADALDIVLKLSGTSPVRRERHSSPRFVAVPLVAPTQQGAVFGLSGIF